MEGIKSDILTAIKTTKELSEETKNNLDSAIEEFKDANQELFTLKK